MLEDEDIKKIGEEVGRVIEQNITPVLDEMNEKIEKMVTKSYLDDKLGDLRGDLIVKLRREDEKVDLLIKILRKRSVITVDDVNQFREFQIFPKTE